MRLCAWASGALSGGVGGALGAATIASSANLMDDFQNTTQQTLEQQGMSTEAARVAAQGIAEAASLGIGALVGGTAGAATSLTVDTNNRQLHPSEAKFIESNAEKYAAQRGISTDQAQEELTRGALYANDAGWNTAYNTAVV